MTRADRLLLLCLLWLAAAIALWGPAAGALLPPLLVYLAVAIDGIARPAAPWLLPLVTHGDRSRPQIALTFDDGPDPEVTPHLLDVLRRYGVHATFFVIAARARRHPDLLRRMAAEGHEIANHSHRHSRLLNFAPTAPLVREIGQAMAALKTVAPGASPTLYRPPMGLKSPWLARAQRRLGLRIVTWSLHARDTGRRTPEQTARHVLQRIRGGDIVLFHDGHDLPGRHRDGVVRALELILPELPERGLLPVTVSSLCSAAAANRLDPAADS